MYNKRNQMKPGQWCWIVQNENANDQYRVLGLFLQFAEDSDDVWMVIRKGERFQTGQYMLSDLIPLHNCSGWHYVP